MRLPRAAAIHVHGIGGQVALLVAVCLLLSLIFWMGGAVANEEVGLEDGQPATEVLLRACEAHLQPSEVGPDWYVVVPFGGVRWDSTHQVAVCAVLFVPPDFEKQRPEPGEMVVTQAGFWSEQPLSQAVVTDLLALESRVTDLGGYLVYSVVQPIEGPVVGDRTWWYRAEPWSEVPEPSSFQWLGAIIQMGDRFTDVRGAFSEGEPQIADVLPFAQRAAERLSVATSPFSP
jgi:hypothetical protein